MRDRQVIWLLLACDDRSSEVYQCKEAIEKDKVLRIHRYDDDWTPRERSRRSVSRNRRSRRTRPFVDKVVEAKMDA